MWMPFATALGPIVRTELEHIVSSRQEMTPISSHDLGLARDGCVGESRADGVEIMLDKT